MTSSQWKEGLPLKIVNVAAYLLFLGSSIYTVVSPQSIYENIKQTYFTPTIWAFLVWPIIHILLLGTVIYQFASTRGKAVVVDGISWEFPLLTILSAIFVVLWANHYHTAAFALCCFLEYIVGNIYWTLKKQFPPKSVADDLFIHLPFSVFQAWFAVIGYLTVFEVFGVDATEGENGIWTNVFVFFALFILQGGAAAFALSSVVGDRPAAFVLSFALWAISDHQRSSPFIHGSATAFFILSLLWDFMAMDGIYRKCTGRSNFLSDDERGPLLGH